MKPLEIYIHIPFCVSKCQYCDFYSYVSDRKERRDYVESLCQEICAHKFPTEAYAVSSIFIGGGTPSILEEGEMTKILSAIDSMFFLDSDVEITIEMNPESVTEERLREYKKIGVNRLSIGLQSTRDEDLKKLGRIHSALQGKKAYNLARKLGFSNINIDLMSALPNQSVKDWKKILSEVVEMNPEHISAYSLILEEGTPFFSYYQSPSRQKELPREEEEREMYWWTKAYLEQHGYIQYEISNYGKQGYACRHNLGYWNMIEFLGFGKGAASFFQNKRWSGLEEEREIHTKEWMEEYMFLGLRKTSGISKEVFYQNTKRKIEEVYGVQLKQLYKEGFLEGRGDSIFLTSKGIDFSNQVFSRFLL